MKTTTKKVIVENRELVKLSRRINYLSKKVNEDPRVNDPLIQELKQLFQQMKANIKAFKLLQQAQRLSDGIKKRPNAASNAQKKKRIESNFLKIQELIPD